MSDVPETCSKLGAKNTSLGKRRVVWMTDGDFSYIQETELLLYNSILSHAT
jgi:hypothetical protein